MVIVSQDKDIIVNFNNVQYIERRNRYIYLRSTNIEFAIGVYTTEERAKEVLQEILDCASLSEISGRCDEIIARLEMKKWTAYAMPKE